MKPTTPKLSPSEAGRRGKAKSPWRNSQMFNREPLPSRKTKPKEST